MGAQLTAPLRDLTKEEVADGIAEFGDRYKDYATLLIDHGMDGGLLDSLDEQGVQETFDDLGITNRLHRRVLKRVLETSKLSESQIGQYSGASTCYYSKQETVVTALDLALKREASLPHINPDFVSYDLKQHHEQSIRTLTNPSYRGTMEISRTVDSTKLTHEDAEPKKNDRVEDKPVSRMSCRSRAVLHVSKHVNDEQNESNVCSSVNKRLASHDRPIFKTLLNNEADRTHLSSNFYDMVDAVKAPRPPIAKNDMERCAAVESLRMTDISPSDEIAYHLETMVKMATEVFGFPYGEITFHNAEFQYRIASYCEGENPFTSLNTAYQSILTKPDGKPFLCKTSRGPSLCNYTIAAGRTFVIKDVIADDTFVWINSLIPVRCYVGSPIKDSSGRIIADLCLFDTKPRPDFEGAHEVQIEQFATIIAQSIESWAIARELERVEVERNLVARGRIKAGPPQGNVALVITDIQGSTALWESDPVAMQAALDLHDTIIRRQSAEHWGYEIETEGDSFVLAFHDPVDAVAFALSTQVTLFEARWSQDILRLPEACEEGGAFRGLRVRIAIHQGHACTDEWGRVSYFGETMKLTKNLTFMTHGGQILTTYETWDVASYFMGKKFGYPQVVDLGTHVLQKGKTRKDGVIMKRIVQLVPCELAFDYFAARKLPTSSNEPAIRVPAVGRRFPLVTSCKQVSPSFHDAPHESNEVTVAFVNLSLVDDCHVFALENLICSLLDGYRSFEGYYCGKEMLVFRRPLDAILFGLLLKKEMSYRDSPEQVVNISQLIKFGCIHGAFLTMGPHRKTGRADYFGQIVNRAARLSSAISAGAVCLGVVCVEATNPASQETVVAPVHHPSLASQFRGRKLLKGIQKEIDIFEFNDVRELQ